MPLITLVLPSLSSCMFAGTFDLADENMSVPFSRLLVPATAACLPTEGTPSTIFRCIEKSDKASIFRSAAISEVLQDGRFKLKAAIAVRELRASVALANLARLDLAGCGFDDPEQLRPLAKNRALARLDRANATEREGIATPEGVDF